MNNGKAPDWNDLLRAHGPHHLRTAFDRAPRNTLGSDHHGPPMPHSWYAPANRHERRWAASLNRARTSVSVTAITAASAPGAITATPVISEQHREKATTYGAPAGDSGTLINGRRLVVLDAANVKPEKIEWVWEGRIARGEHSTVAGDPGAGKSQFTMAVVAAVTTGGMWPCDEGRAPLGNAVILSAEDNVAKTLIPRLIAAGADLARIRIVNGTYVQDRNGNQMFNLQSDLDLLEQTIKSIGNVVLVTIDPVSAYMGGGFDSHKNVEVRRVLQPVTELAGRTNAAVLSVTHFAKANSGTNTKAMHRFIGSVAFTAAPRAAFVVTEDPDDKDRKLFLHAKNNLAKPPQGLAFRLEQTLIGADRDILASSVVWESEPVDVTANEVLAAGGNADRTSLDEAIDFLREELRAGEAEVKVIDTQAKKAGIATRTLKRARAELGIVSRREGFGADGKFFLSMPTSHRGPMAA
jgi:AAA domain-containing protein